MIALDSLPSKSSDFYDDLSVLTPHVKPDAALYVILRRTTAPNGLVAVTYVPNSAPVRQKMLFASTRLSLVRELGTEHFGETIFATTPEELTAEGWRKHEKHIASENPLTEEERSLEGIKAAEALESGGMERRNLSGAAEKELARVAEDVEEALRALLEGHGGNFVQLVRLSLRIPPPQALSGYLQCASLSGFESISSLILVTEDGYQERDGSCRFGLGRFTGFSRLQYHY